MGLSLLQRVIRRMGSEEAFWNSLSESEREALPYDWELWARPEQLPPEGEWRFWLNQAGRGFGKALALDTPIPTPSGWTTMRDMAPGDAVFDESGRPCRVLRVFDTMPERAYRLRFSDGTHLEACSEHQWVTWTHAERKAYLRSPYEEDRGRFPVEWPSWRLRRRYGVSTALPRNVVERALVLHSHGMSARGIERELGVCRTSLSRHIEAGAFVEQPAIVCADSPGPRIRTTQQIVDTLTYGKRGDLNHCIPLAAPLRLPEACLPLSPYSLGVWLGDGDSAGSMLTCADADAELLDLVRADGVTVAERASGRQGGVGRYIMGMGVAAARDATTGRMVSNGSFHSMLGAAGLIRNKHIPREYLRASEAQRRALLAGLMDTDGHVQPHGPVEFCTTKRVLAEGVIELARTLGFRPMLKEGRAKLYGRDVGPKFRVCWTPHEPVFRLTRKLKRQEREGRAQGLRNRHRMIVSAEPIEPRPMRCLTVDGHHSMYLAGEGMVPTHNTRAGAEFVRAKAKAEPGSHGALVGNTPDEARDVMVLGESGVLACCPPDERPEYKRNERLLVWPNGSTAHLYSGHDFEKLRGPQHFWAWVDELAKFKHPTDAFDQVNLGLRLGTHPQMCITTTPKPISILRKLRKDVRCVVTTGSTYENSPNLAVDFLADIRAKYEGTRLGRQELNAELLEDVEGALWQRGPMIDAHRVLYPPLVISSATNKPLLDDAGKPTPKLDAIFVGVDPSVADNQDVDEEDATTDACGIVVAGRAGWGLRAHYYVLEDCTVFGSPDAWAKAAVAAYHRWEANRLVAETNNGGALVEAIIRQAPRGQLVKYEAVTASRGKRTRAEPVSMLAEQGRLHHAGTFDKLEDELCLWVPGMPSPNRLDAMVFAVTALSQGQDASARTRALVG